MASNWLLGITGGIAAYKTPELVRLLKKQGASVRVVLSAGAQAFVTPLTLQAVSGEAVFSHLLDSDFEAAMGHISLARWAQGILIAPLSANRLAALALGLADDLLTTLCLATTAPIFVAPAMNRQMWEKDIVQSHIIALQARGITVLGPDHGEQACGEVGFGRMLEPAAIVDRLFGGRSLLLQGVRVLITAGPTREAIDPVRYLSNRSSGKMGFALAQAARDLGATVTLVAGPVSLPTPCGVHRVDVVSAGQMHAAVMAAIPHSDIFISAAAVADYQAAHIVPHKIKKHDQTLTLDLSPTVDILHAVSHSHQRPDFCVGFAAETQDCEHQARQKLIHKKLDLIALNNVGDNRIGFEGEYNALTVFSENNCYEIQRNTKYAVAIELLTLIKELRCKKLG